MKRRYKILDCCMGSTAAGGKAWVEYSTDHFVEAPPYLAHHGYHLLCFTDYEHAFKFFTSDSNQQIWLCETEDEINYLPSLISLYVVVDPIRLDRYIRRGLSYRHHTFWPVGTLMAKRIKLIRRIS